MTSLAGYLGDFCNIVIAIPGMTEDEKVEKLCPGLNPKLTMEVMKAGPSELDATVKLALNVDNAIFG